jgi:hypothetical protein
MAVPLVHGGGLGQSNLWSADAIPDATYDDQPLHAAVSQYRDNGSLVVVYTANRCGPFPTLFPLLAGKGAAGIKFTRRVANGADLIAMTYTHLPLLLADLRADGIDLDWLLYWQGERESQDPANSPASKAEENLDHLLRLLWCYHRRCRVFLPYLLHRDFTYGPQVLVVDAAWRAVAARYPDRIFGLETRAPTVLDMADTVHARASGHAEFSSRIGLILP